MHVGAGKLMMEVEQISDHFWRETPWGKAMKEQLSHSTQPKSVTLHSNLDH